MRLSLISLGVIILGCILAVVLPSLNTSMNCGGNSAALSHVKQYALIVHAKAWEPAPSNFDVKEVSEGERFELAHIAKNRWIKPGRYLVLKGPIKANATPPQLVIVCDRPFTNVPERWFFKNPPTHAAGYSDGSAVLISNEEFEALDKSKFVPLDTLYPPQAGAKE